MKFIVLFSWFISVSMAFGQDTIYTSKLPSGGESILLRMGSDTFSIQTYPGGSFASKIKVSAIKPKQRYFRYYENGNIMWQKTFENGKANGKASFYDEKGKLSVELMMEDDKVTDTLYLSKKHRILLGNISYSSTVYGGMERVDGGSNVSHSEGPYANFEFYTVKLNPNADSQKIYKRFSTDQYGNFFLCLDEGSYGFFPKTYPIENVKPNSATTDDPVNGTSIEGGWNLKNPLTISSQGIYELNLKYTSVGYAP